MRLSLRVQQMFTEGGRKEVTKHLVKYWLEKCRLPGKKFTNKEI